MTSCEFNKGGLWADNVIYRKDKQMDSIWELVQIFSSSDTSLTKFNNVYITCVRVIEVDNKTSQRKKKIHSSSRKVSMLDNCVSFKLQYVPIMYSFNCVWNLPFPKVLRPGNYVLVNPEIVRYGGLCKRGSLEEGLQEIPSESVLLTLQIPRGRVDFCTSVLPSWHWDTVVNSVTALSRRVFFEESSL